MRAHLILVACCAFPATAQASGGDAIRFERFARSAHATGSLTLTLRFTADTATCAAHSTCGRSGTVTTRLRFDPKSGLRVSHSVVRLPVRGSAGAHTRDTVSGSTCASERSVPAVALRLRGDARGLLLRLAAAPGIDPFATSCRTPTLSALGAGALPAARLRSVARGVKVVRLKVAARRNVAGGGYTARVSSRGHVDL